MPKPYPREFRDDVVRVARDREPGVTVEQIAKDFGVHPMTLWKWMRRADVDEGTKPGLSRQESGELRKHDGGSGCWSRRTSSIAEPGPHGRNCGPRSSPGSSGPTTDADDKPRSDA